MASKMENEAINQELLPRCGKLDGSTLKIVPSYTEAGYFTEANCVTIEDEEGRRAIYVPYKTVSKYRQEGYMSHPRLPVFGQSSRELTPAERVITRRDKEITLKTLKSMLAKATRKRDRLMERVRIMDLEIEELTTSKRDGG